MSWPRSYMAEAVRLGVEHSNVLNDLSALADKVHREAAAGRPFAAGQYKEELRKLLLGDE